MSTLRKLLPPAAACAAASAIFYNQPFDQKKGVPVAGQDRSDRIQGYKITPSRQEKEIRAAAAIEKYMAVSGTPGLSVGVSSNGRMAWTEGFGFADVETGARCSGQSIMRIASISKPITATIAARLIEQGELDIEKPIQYYLKDFPAQKFEGIEHPVTTRQLLCHMSGVRHYHEERKGNKNNVDTDTDPNEANKSTDPEYLSNRPYASVTEALDMFKNDSLVAKPGSKFYYTTHGFTLISAVLEAASGKKFPELAEDLFHELGLSNTRLDKNLPIIPNRTRYYRRNEKTHLLENVPEVDNSYKWAGGGLLSDVTDLLTFANAMLYSFQATPTDWPRPFLRSSTLERLWRGEVANPRPGARSWYGLGWQMVPSIEAPGGTQGNRTGYWYHTGAAVGASSILLIKPRRAADRDSPPRGTCVAILVNCQDCGQGILRLALDIADIFDENF